MVPPHVRPISHASSSPRFSSRSRGRHGGQHVLGLLDHLRVDASADRDGAEHGAALADEHLRALFSRRRAPRVDQRGDGDLASGLPKFVNLIEEFRHGSS